MRFGIKFSNVWFNIIKGHYVWFWLCMVFITNLVGT